MADDWMESAATPEGEALAAAIDAREYLESPEGEMVTLASSRLNDARLQVRDAADALIGLKEPRFRGLGLQPQSAAHLRSVLAALNRHAESVARAIESLEARS